MNYVNGDPKATLEKSGKRKQTPQSRKDEFDAAFDINMSSDNTCLILEIAEYLGLANRTIRKRNTEFSSEYDVSISVILRKESE
ncbi:MAG: hypothetical protein WCW63_04805 [Acholeplasmataceae bacterium]|jgi:hypothetical protein